MSRRYTFFTLAAIFAAVGGSFGQNSVDIESVSLSKERVYTVCHMGRLKLSRDAECGENQALVNVATRLRGTRKEPISIYYIPSGGRIVGSGTDVIWDLTEAMAGKHTISVGIGADDVIGGTIITKTVVIEECPECDPPCSCPTVAVIGPKGAVKAGDGFIVRTELGGGEKLRFKWSTSDGTIIGDERGQSIVIKTSATLAGKEIKVMLEIDGTDPACNCPTMYSVAVYVRKR